jgi:phosphatidylserine decarboxylase
MRIAREGYPYIIPLLLLALALFFFKIWWAGFIFLLLGVFCTYFFRDPERIFRGTDRQVASPADGKVIWIRKVNDLEAISIFMSPLDVHVNRAPVSGKISKIEYMKGKFMVAYDERASIDNERNAITIDHGDVPISFVQIAGILARRIICWRKPGDVLGTGDRIGLIKFGSRVDIFLPPGSRISVQKGQRVKAGESVIGELP